MYLHRKRDKQQIAIHVLQFIPAPIVVSNGAVIVTEYLLVVLFLETEMFAFDS